MNTASTKGRRFVVGGPVVVPSSGTPSVQAININPCKGDYLGFESRTVQMVVLPSSLTINIMKNKAAVDSISSLNNQKISDVLDRLHGEASRHLGPARG